MQEKTTSLTLIPEYFKLLIDLVLETFQQKHNLNKLPKAFQLYGYGAFDENKPSLKKDFEEIGSEFINGKYLYDKLRDFEKGKSEIKLNEHYQAILLLYIGVSDFQKFMAAHKMSDHDYEKQLALIQGNDADSTFYYINYYFGEDNIIIKGKTIISNNWKKIQHVFMYPLEDGTVKEHYSHGSVVRQGDTISIKTKTLSGGKYIDGASEIYYTGHKSLSNIRFLVGTYCTFDIYTNTVAGRAILERCESKEAMEELAQSPHIPAYIAQEVRNVRIVNGNHTIAKNFLELSTSSPYASIYGKLPGTYKITFNFEDSFNDVLEFKILGTNFQIVNLSENVHIEEDRMELLNKGSIVNFYFNFSGIIVFERVNIYLKTYYLRGGNTSQTGVFSGVDNENRLVNGDLKLMYEPF